MKKLSKLIEREILQKPIRAHGLKQDKEYSVLDPKTEVWENNCEYIGFDQPSKIFIFRLNDKNNIFLFISEKIINKSVKENKIDF